MKNKSPLQVLFASVLFLACLLQSSAVLAQENNNCTHCTCSGNLFAFGCTSGKCCKPNLASCTCSIWFNSCGCGVAEMGTLTPQNESNILGMVAHLQSGVFSSAQSRYLADQLPVLIKANKAGNAALYFETGGNLESTSRQLPANEKQLINNWIAARGGTNFIQ
jgi:hypothetical protein